LQVLGEFGAWGDRVNIASRDGWYRLIYDLLAHDARTGGPVRGALFWQWFAPGQVAPAEEMGAGPGGLFGLYETDPAFRHVEAFTQTMQELTQQRSTGGGACGASGPAVVPAPDCSATRVDGIEGTGKEGPVCSVNINECARGTAWCHPDAVCTDLDGSFTCTCPLGYIGNGFDCTPSLELSTIAVRYFTFGEGQLACDEGRDVPWPAFAPGFAYDLTLESNVAKSGQAKEDEVLGSRAAVDPLRCVLACEMAAGCDSFSFNSLQKKCFLKAGASSNVFQVRRHFLVLLLLTFVFLPPLRRSPACTCCRPSPLKKSNSFCTMACAEGSRRLPVREGHVVRVW
jgi:mannan endo-1,4-beta-mannosidase